jgi:hypothetical protein
MSSRWPRWIAIGGMVAILPLAIWLFLLGSLAAAGVFENQEPEDYTRGERLAAAAAVGGVAALATAVGLALRWRILAAPGATAVLISAAVVTANSHLGADEIDPLAWIAFLAVLAVSLLALWAALSASPRGGERDS